MDRLFASSCCDGFCVGHSGEPRVPNVRPILACLEWSTIRRSEIAILARAASARLDGRGKVVIAEGIDLRIIILTPALLSAGASKRETFGVIGTYSIATL
jgi:hypothetical protein